MKVWVHINGVQEGPFNLEELPLDRMTAETPVWYEGLEYWMPAAEAEATAQYFCAPRQDYGGYGQQGQMYQPQQQPMYQQSQQPMYQQAVGGNNGNPQQMPPCPSTYMVWSIVMTLLCCNPIAIVALILGTRVKSKYNNYDFLGAERASELTAWFVMVAIVTSLMWPITMMFNFI